uniref:C-type lectin domain-containing protein n=1 Tax=Panagrolaimus davidi TaxID=227884 RepID=A0A914PU71_9BILA
MLDNVFLSGEASTFFTDSASADFWIGANKLFIPGNWSWLDKSDFDFTDWDKDQPQYTSGFDCVSIFMNGGKWKANDCYIQKPFVCEFKEVTPSTTTLATTKTTTKPSSCQPSWTYYNGFCYKVFDSETWLNAQERCKVDNANLTSIHTLEENLFIANLAYYQGVDGCDWHQQAWIGLFTEDKNAHWNWTDGTPYDYAKWMVGHPNPPEMNQNCGYIFLASCGTYQIKMGDFDNAPCSSVLSRFVCKKLPN